MRGRASRRRGRGGAAGRPRPLALALLLGPGVGCGGAVSLDVAGAVATEPSSTGSTGTGMGTGAAADAVPDDGATETAAPMPDLPPSGDEVCPPGCELELSLAWRWQGVLPVPARVPAVHRVTAMLLQDDGSSIVAERRGDDNWVSRIRVDGELSWSVPIELFCDCEIIGMQALSPQDVVFNGQGTTAGVNPVLSFGHFNAIDGQEQWTTWLGLPGTEERPPRVGPVRPVDSGVLMIPMVIPFGISPATEAVHVRVYDYFGTLIDVREIDTQLATDPTGSPSAGVVGDARMVVAYPSFTGERERGYAIWFDPFSFDPEVTMLPGVPDDLVVTPLDRMVVASHLRPGPNELEVSLTQAASGLPIEWETTIRLASTIAPGTLVALDADARPHLALVTSPPTVGDTPAVRELLLMQLDVHGNERWRSEHPLPPSTVGGPAGLAVALDGDLVVASTSSGRARLERFEPGCACE